MKREFAINIALLLIANLMIKVFYLLGIDRHMQLSLGTEDYGLYYKLLNFTLIFQFINDFGIQNYTNRHVSQNRASITHQYQDFAGVKVGLSLIYAAVLIVFAWILGYEKAVFPLILHLGFNQILVSAILFARSNISGLGHYRTDSLMSVLDRILLIGLGGLLLWHPDFKSYLSIDGFVWVQTLSLSFTLAVCLILLNRYHLRLAFRWMRWTAIRSVLRACLPFAMIYLLTTLYNKMDVVLIARLLEDGNREAGVYAASMRLYEAFSMISLAFGSLLLAMFSALETRRDQLAELFRAAMNLLAVMTICIVVTGVFYSHEIMERLYHREDPYWTRPFVWILLAFLPGSLNYIYGAYYPAVHEENRLVRFYGWSFGFNLLANLVLIPQLKVEGAALSALLTQSLLFGIQLRHSLGSGVLLADRVFWMRILGFCLLAACIVYGSTLLPGHWMIKVTGTVILQAGLAWRLGLVRLSDLLAAKTK